MPKSKSRGKRYDPDKQIRRVIAWGERKIGERPMRADAQRDIEIAAHIAFERLRNGGDKDSLYILASAFDVSHELAVNGYGADYKDAIKRAMSALVRAKKRANLTGLWTLESDEAEVVAISLAIHDVQLEETPRAVVIKAVNDVMARVEAGSGETEFENLLMEAA